MSKLREWRKRKNITQDALAAQLRVRRETVIRWENGDFVPDWPTVVELEDISGGEVDAAFWAEQQRARAS